MLTRERLSRWAEENEMVNISWSELEKAWLVVTRMLDNYDSGGQGWATLVAARRVIEIEMKVQGYEKQWERLVND